MSEITKDSAIGLKVKTPFTNEIQHGSIVSYQAERRTEATGAYGVLDEVGAAAIMLWPGLNTGFGIDIEQPYEEIPHNPDHAQIASILECVRNVKVGEDLGFNITVHPQKTGHWPLLRFVAGSNTALGDSPDSISWLKELAGRYSLFTGVMFEECKVEIPGVGVAKETYSGFAGHRAAVADTSPATTEADENASRPIVWSDITSITMGPTIDPTNAIAHCVSDISFGFTNEVKREIHPESTLTTKTRGVRVVGRKMFVSLKLTWIDQTFLDIVLGSASQYLKMVIGTTPDATTFQFGGLVWPKYISKAEPKELVGDTITAIVDKPSFAYNTA